MPSGTVGYCPGLVPLLYLLDPAPFVFKRYTVEIELESRVSRGCTVMDVLARDKTLPRHAVAVGADWSRLHARLSAQAGLRPAEKEGCFHA